MARSGFWCSLQKYTSTKFQQMALHGITVCLDLTHPSSEINKSPKPGIERELVWFAIDRRPLRPRLASLAVQLLSPTDSPP